MNRLFKRNRAFTLVEIMIVVLIIGILMAIAVPNFVKARESSRKQTCISNLKQIDQAKEQWAMDNRKNAGDTSLAPALTSSLSPPARLAAPTRLQQSEPTRPATSAATRFRKIQFFRNA